MTRHDDDAPHPQTPHPHSATTALVGGAAVGGAAVAAAWHWSARRDAAQATRETSLHRVLIELLLNALSAGDACTERHSRRVADLADALHATYDPTPAAHATLRLGALLHDMGKIDDRFFTIVHSRERLTPAQRAEMAGHPVESARILAPLEPFHPGLLGIVCAHHERWDGEGYPMGLVGPAIPLGARVISAADVFDAISQPRSYQPGRPFAEALDVLQRASGTLFDPDIVARVRRPDVLARWRAIYETGRADEAGITPPVEPATVER